MYKILIAGVNSYIGASFENYIKSNYSKDYFIETVNMHGDEWNKKSFEEYDSVFYVTGIAHSDAGKITKEKEKLYYNVNSKLTIEVAKKAKKDGVKQFIFMSSMIIYDASDMAKSGKVITKDTEPVPGNCYGNSKLIAERELLSLDERDFKVVIIRSPMVYGENCKGNYKLLAKFSRVTPIFPYVKNERSMIYIENLCEFVRLMVKNREQGIFCPQNKCTVNTSELVRTIAEIHGKKVYFLRGLDRIWMFLSKRVVLFNKLFGSFVYDSALSAYKEEYCVCDFKSSIRNTEMKRNKEKND